MKVGVIGYGSIGKRHINNLINLGIKDIILLRELNRGNELDLKEVFTIEDLLKENIDFIILSNPTSYHYKFLSLIIGAQIPVFAEKPLVLNEIEIVNLKHQLKDYKKVGMTAFNMRFHPCVKKALELVQFGYVGEIYQARFFVGQYLPDWHPNTDYKKSYSARIDLGGGVLMDLIHEIDLAYIFTGPSSELMTTYIGQFGKLDIETEDTADITYISKNNILVNIHLDYLNRGIKRDFQLYGSKGWVSVDLVENNIKGYSSSDGTKEYSFKDFVRNQMYLEILKTFIECLKSGESINPDLVDGLRASDLAVKARKHNNFQIDES